MGRKSTNNLLAFYCKNYPFYHRSRDIVFQWITFFKIWSIYVKEKAFRRSPFVSIYLQYHLCVVHNVCLKFIFITQWNMLHHSHFIQILNVLCFCRIQLLLTNTVNTACLHILPWWFIFKTDLLFQNFWR